MSRLWKFRWAVVLLLACPGVVSAQFVPVAGGKPSPTALHLRSGLIPLDGRTSLHKANGGDQPLAQRDHFVVQLDGPLTPQRQAQLAQAGVKLGQYLPMHSYLVTLPAGFKPATAMGKLDFVRWVGAFDKAWKVDPLIGQVPFQTRERIDLSNQGNVKLAVKVFEGENLFVTANQIANVPGTFISDLQPRSNGGLMEITMPRTAYAQLADIHAVQWVEEAPEIVERNDTNRWILQSNVLNSTPVWDHGITGVGQIGGHIDNALDPTHCAFNDPSGNPIGPTHRKILAYFGSQKYIQHGTFTGGIFVGDPVPYNSDPTYRGMAYSAKMVCTRLNTVTSTNLLSKLQQDHDAGARVHTNSWGTDFTQAYNQQVADVDAFSYSNEDSLVLFAITNQNSVVYTPENSKNCLAVSGTQDTPSQNTWCIGGFAPTLDGRRKPEVMSPACGVISSNGGGNSCVFSTAGVGTSYACPSVSGAGLLVREYFTDGFYPSGAANAPDAFTPTGALIKATLINSAVDMTGISGYPSNQEGWGRVLLDNALYFTGDARKLIVDDVRNASGLATGKTKNYLVTVNSSSQPLKVVLVWTDPAAAVNANPAYINDLNLTVTDSANQTYLGNVFDTVAGQSITGGSADFRNNTEVVQLNTPATGTFTVSVNAAAVNVGATQGYAIVMTGDISVYQVPPPPGGDCDGNGIVEIGPDTDCFVDVLLGNTVDLGRQSRADMNGDTLNDGNDIALFVNCLINGCP
jgi:hypothetical protein